MYFIVAIVLLFILELLYFRLADRFNIIDKPNERSSHTSITIRGGGIIFYFSIVFHFFYSGFNYPIFFIGLTLGTIISFLDDILTLSSKVRLPIQLLAVALMLFEIVGMNYTLILLTLIIATGILNAYNFMDGINGITGVYSMVTILSLMMFNSRIGFIDDQFLHFSLAGVLVFNFYNFRKRAKCFAGDVGSVSMALIVMFAIGLLIYSTNNLMFILLLAVYGVDSVLTIIHRLAKKENIFEAHRSHLYQWMVKPGPFSHLQMAAIYGMLQILINAIVFVSIDYPASKQLFISACILILMAILYISIKLRYKKKYNLV